jgi:hypothetical protein
MAINWEDLLHNGYSSVSEMITEMHWKENLTIEEMSEKLGIGHSTLKRKISELSIKMKPKGGIAFSKFGKKGRKINGHSVSL